jgi:hypothetical protein
MLRARVMRAVSAVMVMGSAALLSAQAPGTAAWEVEVHGGFAAASTSTSGTTRLPPAGALQPMTVFAGVPPRVQTRLVPSWFFGDGPVLLSQALPPDFRIAPLDPLLATSIAAPRSGGSVGFRVARRLTPRLSAEFSFDRNARAIAINSDAPAQIESSRASFAKMWGAVAGLPIFGPPSLATATATLTPGGAHESLAAGALVIDIGSGGRILPYAVVGAGAVMVSGDLPSAQLTGDYRLQITFAPGPLPPAFLLPGFPPLVFHETDLVTIRGSRGTAPAAVFGGGARLALSPRAGIRIDLRDHVSRDTGTTLVDAAPTATPPAPPGTGMSVQFFGSTPVVQISNVPGIPSSLSDKSVIGFETFRAHGLSSHLNISAGLYFRF